MRGDSLGEMLRAVCSIIYGRVVCVCCVFFRFRHQPLSRTSRGACTSVLCVVPHGMYGAVCYTCFNHSSTRDEIVFATAEYQACFTEVRAKKQDLMTRSSIDRSRLRATAEKPSVRYKAQ